MLKAIRHLVKGTLMTESAPPIVRAVRAEGLTYLEESALKDIYYRVEKLELENNPGILIEAGCALGGSAIVMAAAKKKARSFYVYDVFGMIPPPSDADGADVHNRYETIVSGQSKGIKGAKYYGYEEDLLTRVNENFDRHKVAVRENNIHLVKGLFEDSMRVSEPVALAHIDGDWYQSVLTCLERIEPHLVSGGVLIIDDYDAWSGCRKAVDEYFSDKLERYEFVRHSRLHVVRKKLWR